MKAAIMQPTYLPWMGYFGMIDIADTFIFYDDVQFEKQSWQQRNKIKIADGKWMWISVPVIRNSRKSNIKDVQICNNLDWKNAHMNAIYHGYIKAPYFKIYQDEIKKLYQEKWESLCDMNISIILKLLSLLKIKKPEIIKSSELDGIVGVKTERLISILVKLGISEYVTVPGTRDYLETNKFKEKGIKLHWYEFQHPVYPQIRGDFIPYLSAIDLLFNTGDQAIDYIRQGCKDALKLETDQDNR